MRVLLSTIGSRGEVQPVVALAVQLRALGQEVRVCAPPDFRDWIDTLGIPFVSVGPRGAQYCGVQLTSRAGPTLTRAAASDGGSRGRHPVRGDPYGSPRLRRPRGRRSTAIRRSLGGRADGNPLRLRQLLPDNPALPTPCPSAIVTAGRDAVGRYCRQSHPLGSGCATLEQHLRRRSQLASSISWLGLGH